MMKLAVTLTTVALLMGGTAAFGIAQAEPSKPPQPRSAKSIECSKLADAKGLHGKARKVFRAKCRKGES